MPDSTLTELEERLSQIEAALRLPGGARRRPLNGRMLRWPRRALSAAAALILVLMAGVALASDTFEDVPVGYSHHNTINALAGAGITRGCNPSGTQFCPLNGVTRGEMARFLNRGLGRAASAIGSVGPLPDDYATVASVSIRAGGATGGTAFIYLSATFTGYNDTLIGCPCAAQWIIVDGEGIQVSNDHYTQIDAAAGTFGLDSGAISALVAVPTNVTQTFHLKAREFGGGGTIDSYGDLIAISVPFDGQGGNPMLTVPLTLGGPLD